MSKVDLVTVELIERALRGLRDEMDAVVLRSSMSPIIREQHDEFPNIFQKHIVFLLIRLM